jgi:hypothetical protein
LSKKPLIDTLPTGENDENEINSTTGSKLRTIKIIATMLNEQERQTKKEGYCL